MAKRNHIFIAARNRNSAGPMNSKKNDMIDEYHEAEKDEFLLSEAKNFQETETYKTIASDVEATFHGAYIEDEKLIQQLRSKYSDEDIIKTLLAFLKWIY